MAAGDVVQFALNGQYMYLSSVIPALNAGTYFVLVRYSTWPGAGKYADAVAVRHATTGNATYCEASGDSGNLLMSLNFNAEETLDTGSDTTWRWVVMRLSPNAGQTQMDVLQADPANVSGTIAITQTDTRSVANAPDRVMFAANTSFLGDMGGTLRYAWIFVLDRACTDQEIEDFCNDPDSAEVDADCIFFNDCTDASVVGTDSSGTGNDATVNGTPTTVSGDDPRPSSGLTGTGAVSLPNVTIAGTGTYSPAAITGTGAVSVPNVTLAGSGTYAPQAITGTGAVTLPNVVVTGYDLPAYEYTISANGRYYLRNGTPWWMNGEWGVQIMTLSLADAEDYLDSCVSHGINCIEVELITQQAGAGHHGPQAGNGEYPFTTKDGGGAYVGAIGTADLSTPNSAYFAYARQIVDLAADRGIRCMLMYMPLGFDGPTGLVDFCQDLLLTGNDTTKCATYGDMVATHFRDALNVTWLDSSDYGDANTVVPSATCKSRLGAIRTAMESGGCLQLYSYDGQSPSLSTDQSTFGVLSHENGCYTYGGTFASGGGSNPTPNLGSGGLKTYIMARRGWQYTPTASTQSRDGLSTPSALPCYLQETAFLNSTLANYTGTAEEIRRAQWWAILSGCTAGLLWGDEEIWPFTDVTWQAAMNTDGRNDMLRLSQLIATIPWYDLVPSEQSGTTKLIGGARGSQTGSPDDYIAAAGSGTLMLAYVPDDGTTGTQTFEVDLTEMAASNIRLRWWDPTANTFEVEAGGVANTEDAFEVTTPGANAAGQNDWLLVADIVTPVTGTAAVSLPNVIVTASGTYTPPAITGTGAVSITGLRVLGFAQDGDSATVASRALGVILKTRKYD